MYWGDWAAPATLSLSRFEDASLLFQTYYGDVIAEAGRWIYYFFRDPDRFPIKDENYLISPADGKITQIIGAVVDVNTLNNNGNDTYSL